MPLTFSTVFFFFFFRVSYFVTLTHPRLFNAHSALYVLCIHSIYTYIFVYMIMVFMCTVSKSIVIYIIKSILILFSKKWSCALGLEFLSGLISWHLHQCFINIWYALYLDCDIFVSPFSSLKLLNYEQTLNSDSNLYYKEKKTWLGKNQWLVELL